jgi:hypothetical protein
MTLPGVATTRSSEETYERPSVIVVAVDRRVGDAVGRDVEDAVGKQMPGNTGHAEKVESRAVSRKGAQPTRH